MGYAIRTGMHHTSLSVCLMCYDNGVYSEYRSHNCMVTEVKKIFFLFQTKDGQLML